MRDLWVPERRVLRAAILGTLVTLLALGAANASAATYHAYLCKVPVGPNTGLPAPTEGTSYTANTATGAATDSCAGGGAMTAALDGSATHQVGEGAAVIYDAPGALTIAGFRVWRHEGAGPGGAGTAPFTKFEYAASQLEPECSRAVGCSERGNASSPFAAVNEVAVSNLSGVTSLRWNAFCGGTPGATCPVSDAGTRSAVYDVFAADLLLDDPTPPKVTSVGGPLLSGAPLTGTQTASVNVEDGGSGVYKGSLAVDGTVVVDGVLDAVGGSCAELGASADGRPAFLHSQPCPSPVTGVLTLHTDLLAPGQHDLVVRISDGAGNQTTAATTKITTTGPRPQGANGSGASRFAKLTARFTGRTARTRRLGYGSRPTITGRLVDEDGHPIAAAAIDVLARERRSGARSGPIATATTAPDGTFRSVLPGGASRTITVRYTAFSSDPKPSAAVTLRALVAARLSASISSRSPRTGRTVRLSGRLRYLPRRGVIVTIQARNHGVWQTADTVETRTDGRFSWPHRFRADQAGRRFVFRARVKSPNYPFEPGTSPTIAVRVRR